MSADSNGDSRPSVSDIVNHKSKTEVKNKPPQSSEHKPFSERLLDIRDKITSILNKRELSNQTPPQTLQELSAIEVPQDTENPEPVIDQSPEIPLETKPIIHDTTQQDQQQAKELAQHTKTEAAKLTEPVVEAPIREPLPLLYTDGPTLYDKYSKTYTKEKRSFFGALSRRADVRQLKKAGVKDAAKIYDALRSRGIPGSSIVRETNESKRNRFSELYDRKTLTPAEKSDLLQKAPAIIDRLDSINYYYEFSLENLSINQLITTLDNQQFQERRLQIQPLFFLDSPSIISYLSDKNPDPKVDLFIKYFTSDFINNQVNSKDSFSSIKDMASNIIRRDYFGGYTTDKIDTFTKSAIYSNLNPDQPIKLPENLISRSDYRSKDIIRLNNLPDRQQQRFILENYQKKYSYFTDSNGHEMFTGDIPNIYFYRQFLFSETNQGQKITIPQETLDLIDDPAQKTFYQNVSNLNNPNLQRICIDNSTGLNVPNYFSETGQPNANLFADYLTQNRQLIRSKEIPDISTEELSRLSIKDQGKIKIIQSTFELEDQLGFTKQEIYFKLLSSLNHNYDNFNLFHNQENQPNLLLFKKALSVCTTTDQIQKLIPIIKDKLPTFSDAEKSFCNNVFSLKESNDVITQFIINLSDTTPIILFNENGYPTNELFKSLINEKVFNHDFFTANLTPETINSFPLQEQLFWKGISQLKNPNYQIAQAITLSTMYEGGSEAFFDQNGTPKLHLFEALAKSGHFSPEFFSSNLTPEVMASFSLKDQIFWKNILKLTKIDAQTAKGIVTSGVDSILLFNQDSSPNLLLFETLSKNGYFNPEFFTSNLTPEVMASFSTEDQILWKNLIKLEFFNNKDFMSFLFSGDKSQFTNNGEVTSFFYQELAYKYTLNFIDTQNRNFWKITFGDEAINDLLDNLPKSTDEKRNAFTHNPYDRTSEFFKFLFDYSPQTNFKLDIEHLQIASEYIKKCGFAKSAQFYNYFQSLSLYQQGKISILPEELTNNNITSIEDLIRSREAVQKKCFSSDPIIDVSGFSPFELTLLSTATGHSSNRFTRTPIETIISDFSKDMSEGQIAPLPPEFYPETIKLSQISIETDKQINDSPKLTALRQEILNAIDSPNDISSETRTISELFNQRINNLSKETQQTDPAKAKKQEFIQKQIDSFKQKVSEISESKTTDQLLNALVTFNLNLGEDQEKFNSILRQLVFKKVFDKHQNSPGWQEGVTASLREGASTVNTVDSMQNLISNTIKDHVLNFETQNQDGYWSESTFETVKKYSTVFKKNLGFSSFINELNSYQKSFIIKDLNQQQTIEMAPDRGLMGEMSGYMADVCYTKVYPLLKQFPNLAPYKFISNPTSESPEFIGSTLVFKVEDIDNNPVFLIRAFDIPNENSVDIGKFFESFVDHLTPIAKKLGIRKILAAGTAGTISNYSKTTNYVLSQYVNDKVAVELKDTFDFNSYNITHHCYQVRDLS